MTSLRWVNDPDGPTWTDYMPYVFYFIGAIAGLSFILWGLISFFIWVSGDPMVKNYVTQSNHLQVVTLKSDKLTRIKLPAAHEQELPFKTCDDYEVVSIQKVYDRHHLGRSSYRDRQSVEIFLKVKRTFDLHLNYLDYDGKNCFLLTTLRPDGKYK